MESGGIRIADCRVLTQRRRGAKAQRAMGLRILFVENHPVFAKTVITQFLPEHQIIIAPSLTAARLALEQNQFDLLLVDYDLDDGKGDELVEEIRGSRSELKVIGVSAHAEGNSALLEAGADAVCGKMDFDHIDDIIRKVCNE
jgi:DNA-binding response OmpR family regulator